MRSRGAEVLIKSLQRWACRCVGLSALSAVAMMVAALSAGATRGQEPAAWSPTDGRATILELRDGIYGHPVRGEPLRFDVYRPADPEVRPVEIWLHGGGMETGSKGGWTATACRAAAAEGRVCFDANYRLTPDGHRWPSQLYDVKALVRYIRAHAEWFGADPSRIAVNGHSAGGQLATLLGTTNGEIAWVTCDESADSPYTFVAPANDCAGEPPAAADEADVQVAGTSAGTVDMHLMCELMARENGWYDEGYDRAWYLNDERYLMPSPYAALFEAGDCVQNVQLVEDFGPQGQGPGEVDALAYAEWLEASPLWRTQNGGSRVPTAIYAPLPLVFADGDGDGLPGVTVDGAIELCSPGVNADVTTTLVHVEVPMGWGDVEAPPGDPNPYTIDDAPTVRPCWSDAQRTDLHGWNYARLLEELGVPVELELYPGCPHTLISNACADGRDRGDEILAHWAGFLAEHGF